MHKVYVYGTLRRGNSPTVDVPGEIRDLGWFPGAVVKAPDFGETFKAEIIEVDDTELKRLDRYEGYVVTDPAHSLYVRVPYLDGWIYVYNKDMSNKPKIEGGDWLEYTKSERGVAARN